MQEHVKHKLLFSVFCRSNCMQKLSLFSHLVTGKLHVSIKDNRTQVAQFRYVQQALQLQV